jgi:hypothetical protein
MVGMLAGVAAAALTQSRGHRGRVLGIATVPDGISGITLMV